MKYLILLLLMTACGSADSSGDGASADPTPGGWVGNAAENVEMSCSTFFYPNVPVGTNISAEPCRCLRQAAQAKYTYADFNANSHAYWTAFKTDGTAKGCGVPQ